jgi:drug/metabolite transporter (DMT)-like permease
MTSPPRLAYLAWAATCIIWGTTYLAIRVGLAALPPALMGGFRWTIASALLVAVVYARGERLPGPDSWRDLAVQGVFMLGFGNGCVNWAEQYVPSGLAAVLIATVPFFMTGVEALFPDGERPGRMAIAGLIVGFAGILVLLWPDVHFNSSEGLYFLAGVVSLQIACLGWSIGSAYSKRHRHPGQSILGQSAVQMLSGGLVMFVVGTIAGEWSRVHMNSHGLIAMAYLILAGSLGGFVSYVYALKHLPVTLVSLYAYVNPLIAVVLGAVALGEPFGVRTLVAMGIVFVGIGLVHVRRTDP